MITQHIGLRRAVYLQIIGHSAICITYSSLSENKQFGMIIYFISEDMDMATIILPLETKRLIGFGRILKTNICTFCTYSQKMDFKDCCIFIEA